MTPDRPAWIELAEEYYKAKYVGQYDLPNREGPFHIFYQEEIPEKFRGDDRYDNYLALFWRPDPVELQAYLLDPDGVPEPKSHLYVTGARSIRDAVFEAIEYEEGKFIVSRYRHDFVKSPNGKGFLDGGLAYTRCNPAFPPTHTMVLIDGNEVYTPIGQGGG